MPHCLSCAPVSLNIHGSELWEEVGPLLCDLYGSDGILLSLVLTPKIPSVIYLNLGIVCEIVGPTANNDRMMGIVIGVGISSVCIVICVIIILLRNRLDRYLDISNSRYCTLCRNLR